MIHFIHVNEGWSVYGCQTSGSYVICNDVFKFVLTDGVIEGVEWRMTSGELS